MSVELPGVPDTDVAAVSADPAKQSAPDPARAAGSSPLEIVSRCVQLVSVVAGVVVSVVSVNVTRQAEAAAQKADSERREIEAAKPFLDMQQQRYQELLHTIAVLATPENHTDAERAAATQRFWDLRWSELGIVAGPQVEAAVQHVADDLYQKADGHPPPSLHDDIFALSHGMRDSMMATWGIDRARLK